MSLPATEKVPVAKLAVQRREAVDTVSQRCCLLWRVFPEVSGQLPGKLQMRPLVTMSFQGWDPAPLRGNKRSLKP